MLRDPLFDLDDKDVILELWPELAEEHTKLEQYVWVDRYPLPVMAFAANPELARG